jgi:hypothetical protein
MHSRCFSTTGNRRSVALFRLGIKRVGWPSGSRPLPTNEGSSVAPARAPAPRTGIVVPSFHLIHAGASRRNPAPNIPAPDPGETAHPLAQTRRLTIEPANLLFSPPLGRPMQLGRTILIFLIALSVAILPGSGSAAFKVKPADMSHMSSAMDDMDCCPHKKLPSEKAIDDCCSFMATCPMNCFGIAGTSSLLVFPLLLGDLPFSLASNPLHSQTGSTPFRPPRG